MSRLLPYFENDCVFELASPLADNATQMTIVLPSDPIPAVPFIIKVHARNTDGITTTQKEIIKVTAVNGSVLDIQRITEGGTARSFVAGDVCKVVITAGIMDLIDDLLQARALLNHSHAISDITDLVTTLAGKAAATHTHTPGSINLAASSKIVGRKTAGAGVAEEITLSELLDFIGSAAEGDILYRGSSAWQRLAKGAAGKFIKMNSGATAPEWGDATGGTTILTAYKTADETVIGSSSLQDDDHLFVSVEANKTYLVELTLHVETYNFLDGIWLGALNMGFSIPSGTTGFISFKDNTIIKNASSGNWEIYYETLHTKTSLTNFGETTLCISYDNSSLSAQRNTLILTGVITTSSTAGNFKFRFSQGVAYSNYGTTVKKGSLMKLTKLN